MNFSIAEIVQYGGWFVTFILSIVVGKQQLEASKQKLEFSEFKNITEQRISRLNEEQKDFIVKIINKLKTIEDSLDLRFDVSEKNTLEADKNLEIRIAKNETNISSSKNWISRLVNFLLFNLTGETNYAKQLLITADVLDNIEQTAEEFKIEND